MPVYYTPMGNEYGALPSAVQPDYMMAKIYAPAGLSYEAKFQPELMSYIPPSVIQRNYSIARTK